LEIVSAGPSAEGGAWTGVMVLTHMFALMGIQPAPRVLDVGVLEPRPGAVRAAAGVGVVLRHRPILFVFTAMQGMGDFLGATSSSRRRIPIGLRPVRRARSRPTP
jgi:solute:Na+ symporter, SSS family